MNPLTFFIDLVRKIKASKTSYIRHHRYLFHLYY